MVDKKFHRTQQIKRRLDPIQSGKKFDEKINLNRKYGCCMIDFYLNPFEQQIDFLVSKKQIKNI